MKLLSRCAIILTLSLSGVGLLLSPSTVAAQTEPKFVIKPVAGKKLALLPAGPLFWRTEAQL